MKKYIEVKRIGNWNDGEEAAYRAVFYSKSFGRWETFEKIFHAPWDAPWYVVGYRALEAFHRSFDEDDIPVYRSTTGRKIYSRKWENRAEEWEWDWEERHWEAMRKRRYF